MNGLPIEQLFYEIAKFMSAAFCQALEDSTKATAITLEGLNAGVKQYETNKE